MFFSKQTHAPKVLMKMASCLILSLLGFDRVVKTVSSTDHASSFLSLILVSLQSDSLQCVCPRVSPFRDLFLSEEGQDNP